MYVPLVSASVAFIELVFRFQVLLELYLISFLPLYYVMYAPTYVTLQEKKIRKNTKKKTEGEKSHYR